MAVTGSNDTAYTPSGGNDGVTFAGSNDLTIDPVNVNNASVVVAMNDATLAVPGSKLVEAVNEAATHVAMVIRAGCSAYSSC